MMFYGESNELYIYRIAHICCENATGEYSNLQEQNIIHSQKRSFYSNTMLLRNPNGLFIYTSEQPQSLQAMNETKMACEGRISGLL